MIDLAPHWPTIVRRAKARTEARRAQEVTEDEGSTLGNGP